MIAKNPAPPPPHLFSLARRRWKDSLVGLLHILPRLGKSGGHIPHSSLPFSYSLRLSFFFFSLSLSPPSSSSFSSSPCWSRASFVGAGGKTHGTRAKGNFLGEVDWVGGRDAPTRRFLELRRASVVKPCSLEYKPQQQQQRPFTAKCALSPATWI